MWVPGEVEVQLVFDAETCPDPIPPGYVGCMVYAGGSSAAHAWEQAELDRVAHMPRLPVWVPTPGRDDPAAAAAELLAWLKGHGVEPVNPRNGQRVHVMWDMETGKEPDAAWLDQAASHVAAGGYWNWVYGSISTLFGQPARDGYVVANPTGQIHMYLHPQAVATQFQFEVAVSGGTIDRSAFTRAALGSFWLP